MKIGLNTQLGIELAQQKRTAEALAYLRYAVRTEPVNAEIWLWLAHVSPDLEEYRNCVHQALSLDPNHPTALRMQQDLNYQVQKKPPPVTASDVAQTLSRKTRRQRRRRRLLLLLNAIMLVVACGLFSQWSLENISWENIETFFTEPTKSLAFGVGNENEIFHFRVKVPDSWYLADTGSPSWRLERSRLQKNFTEISTYWTTIETDLGTIQRQSDGTLSSQAVLVETDTSLIERNPQAIARLSLVAIISVESDNSCQTLANLASSAKFSQAFIEAKVLERSSGECIYYERYEETTSEDVPIYLYILQIPVEVNQLAIWQLVIPKALYEDHYKETVNQILNSLRYA